NQKVEVLVALILVNCLASAVASSLAKSPDNFLLDEEPSSPLPSSYFRSPHRIDGYYTPPVASGSVADLQRQQLLQRSQNFKISPKPCSFGRIEGTCMFVWECIKSEGRHVGMCVDSFMFGSCCTHNYTDNIVLPQTMFAYTRPTRPLNLRPPPQPYKPAISGMTTIERPHGAGTLVIRPSGPHHQGSLSRPQHTKPTSSSSTAHWTSTSAANTMVAGDLQSAASMPTASSNSIWHTSTQQQLQQQQQHHWHMPTEPSFITKPRPTGWNRPGVVNLPARPSKPAKPTKKPILYERPSAAASTQTSVLLTQTKPTKPQLSPATSLATSTKPTSTRRPTTTTTIAKPSTAAAAAAVATAAIETNEITDSTHVVLDAPLGNASVKTISAARSECGMPMLARPETRIVGGKSAAFGRWPWQVSVRRTSFFGFSSTHRCGGALINENWIATAGHCVDDLLISQIRIRVGEYDFSHVQEQLPYIERSVAKKVVHPKYNFFTYEYDLALVKLEQPLEFAPHVSPICLPETDSLLIGMNATVTGWGRLSEGGTLPSVLQEVSVPIVSNDNCKSMFLRAGRQEFIPDIFLCAGFETGGHDSCQGDSGGPLQAKSSDGRFFLAGIISWGIGCAEANLPGVCTRISKFVPWILEHVR
ncbi:serine proteinase stubble, partial [Scaptodrosophila lebanonensis]|uniref:Serine proteinase stubble n=1 Tax=Drosophila lebanonensis TaxID=7225 RepID=A0A6J2TK22_DROLE